MKRLLASILSSLLGVIRNLRFHGFCILRMAQTLNRCYWFHSLQSTYTLSVSGAPPLAFGLQQTLESFGRILPLPLGSLRSHGLQSRWVYMV